MKTVVTLCVAAVLLFSCGIASAQKYQGKWKKPQPPKSKLPEAVRTPLSSKVIEVAPVDRSTRPDIQKAAKKIDKLLAAHWADKEVKPSTPLSDQQFLRRVFLELGGRIPSYYEVKAFLDSDRDRGELIDYLLESPAYVSHFYNFWADILRLVERPQRNLVFEPYLFYVKDSIASNKPYNTWVHEMLTADGLLWENPAVGFQLRDSGMPLPYVDNTIRVLLGKQIGCAQCHDHPFDDWTQHQFYELAAFLSGTKLRGGNGKSMMSMSGSGSPQKLIKEARADAVKNNKSPAGFIQFIQANTTNVSFKEAPLKLPHDYQYDDAKPLAVVSPKVLWGEIPANAKDKDKREQLASWIVRDRQFARMIANRMWKKIMGIGIVEPIDDFQDGNVAILPELLEHLTDEMIRLDFDLREFVRILVSTDVYQREAVVFDPSEGTPFRFTAPALRRMTAEQLWDSIVTLVAYNAWGMQRPTANEIAQSAGVDFSKATFESASTQYQNFNSEFGRGRQMRSLQQKVGYKGQLLVRASEIPTPLPLGHFLRQFGQSDREVIEGSRTVATVPQILTMFNGPITHSMLEVGSVIYDNVVAAVPKGPNEVITVIFMSLLSHPPTLEERRLGRMEIESAETPAAGYGNLIWALLNTREFIFIQ